MNTLIASLVLAFAPLLPPCATEDGSPEVACVWDATSQGNGEGVSYVMLTDESSVLLPVGVQ